MLLREGAEAHETFSHRFRAHEMPLSVGRFHGRLRSWVTPTLCGFRLAWLSCRFRPPALTNRDNPQRAWFPGIPFGYALPSFALPARPADGPQPPRLPSPFRSQPSSDALDL